MKCLSPKLPALVAVVSALYTCALTPAAAVADPPADALGTAAVPDVNSDLTLSTFFTDGWDQPWKKYRRGEGTADMSLLRVQTNFLVQLFRLDLALQTGRNSPHFSQGESATAIIEYALNRRFMPGLYVNHQWLDGRDGPDDDGSAGGVFTRFQLLEHRQSSLALTLKMALPDHDLGEHLTAWSWALAGWHDLEPIGLAHTGLYCHVQHEILGGPASSNATRNDTTYDISLAHTWTSHDCTLQHLTTFVEAYGKTLLDGAHEGRTTVSLTPGFRFTLASRHILMFGVDVPVAGPRADDNTWRFSWVANF